VLLGDRSEGPGAPVRAGVLVGDRSEGPGAPIRAGVELGDRSEGPGAPIRAGVELGDRSEGPGAPIRAGIELGDRSEGPGAPIRAGVELGDRSEGPGAPNRSGVLLGGRDAQPPPPFISGIQLGDRSGTGGPTPGDLILTVAGASNDNCTDCGTLNRTFVLHLVSPTTYFSDVFTFCGNVVSWQAFTFDGINWVLLIAGGVSDPQWTSNAFNPTGSTVWSFSVDTGNLCHWPATVRTAP